jgi:hypothetical protein
MAKQAPEFAEWLSNHDAELKTFLEDETGMPEDPFSEEGLRRVEELILAAYRAKEWMWLECEPRACAIYR